MTMKTAKPTTSGDRAWGETALHKQAKSEIARAMRRHASDIMIERRLDGVRPDVSCRIRKRPVAVEVQYIAITAPEIRRRTYIYTALGYYVIWLVPLNALLAPKPYEQWRLTSWQGDIVGVYGYLYVWLRGQTILVIGGKTTHLITDLHPVEAAVREHPCDMPAYDNYSHLLSLHRGSTTSRHSRVYGEEAHAECERLGQPAPVRLWTLPPSE